MDDQSEMLRSDTTIYIGYSHYEERAAASDNYITNMQQIIVLHLHLKAAIGFLAQQST